MSLLLLFPLSGCVSSDEEETALSLLTAPVNLDPQLAQGEETLYIVRQLFEGLVAVQDGQLMPAAAADWTVSDDGKVYTFTLRADAAWSDGEPLTAEDFVFAFTRLFDPMTAAPAASDFTAIQGASGRLAGEDVPLGVTADGDILTFTLAHPDNRFLYLLTTAAASPCREDFFLDTHGRYGLEKDTVLGNGRYTLSTWSDALLRLRPCGEEGTVLRLDIGGEAASVLETPDEKVYGLLFSQSDPLFAQSSARQALLNSLPDTLALPDGLLPAALRQGMDKASFPQRDLTAARALYQSGVAASSDTGYGKTILLPADDSLAEDFSAVAQVWQRDLGFYLAVSPLPEAELLARVEAGAYDCALVALTADYPHPAGILSRFTSDHPENPCGYQNEEYDALFARAVQENDPEKARALYAQAEQFLLDDGVFIPLFVRG